MRGDWKDQRLNEHYQRNIIQQAKQQQLTQATDQGSGIYLRILVIQTWLESLLHPRRFAIYESEPVLKTQNLRTVK